MKKRILFGILWVIAFPMAHAVASMFMFAILGSLGFGQSPPPTVLTAGWKFFGVLAMVWAWSLPASVVIALVLSYFGVLPGTRQKKCEVGA
jgi:hypothetical protein